MSSAGAAREPAAPGEGATPRIAVLDSLVADQIAAGEVIERPASVVKELVENALDAGAREVEIELGDGGRESIVVRDDGSGMHPEDAARACLRHATSKLRTLDDLQRIASFGFRGEALASIASVAEVTVATRARGHDAGVRVVVRDGAVRESAPAGLPSGTTIEVRSLFASVPARRKFLRSAATETSHVTELLQRLALGRPDVGIACRQGGRDLLRYPAVARSEERLRQVLGAARARAMVAVDGAAGGVAVRGFASRAGESVAQARSVLTYVNGRLVRDRLLMRAILDAYRALLPQGRYPVVVLQVELAPALVDVNVHPTKVEVRFSHGDAVYSAVLHALRAALAAGVSAPGGARGALAEESSAPEPSSGGAARVAEALSRYGARARAGERIAEGERASGAATWGAAARAPGELPFAAAPPASGAAGVPTESRGDASTVPLAQGSEETAVAGELAAPPARFADLQVIGQAFRGYLVCEGEDALVLIDQHAAHERVRFERLRAERRAHPERVSPSQQLLVPRVVELEASACAALLEATEELAAAGFAIEAFGERSLVVRSLPVGLDVATDPERLLAEIAADLATIGGSERMDAARDALLARVACHGAVRVGDRLAAEEMTRLLADLDTIPFAATCPHGRPLAIELPRSELQRRVRRT